MQKKSNYYTDNSDLEFHFEQSIDWDTLFSLASDKDKETLHVSSAKEYKKLFVDLITQIGKSQVQQSLPTKLRFLSKI